MRIVITGGHHSSALPVIPELKKSCPNVEIFWFGHKRSSLGDRNSTLEFSEITSLGIPFFDLKAGKVYKTFNIWRLLKVPFGFFQALFWLIKIRPDVILSFGGYLAVPVVLAGWILCIPSVTHEQTVVAGYANKVISFFAKKICLGWRESEKYFPKNKVVYSGVPLRRSIFEIRSDNINPQNYLPTVYITAGKTGSHIINEVIKDALPELLSIVNLVHQCGDHSKYKDYEHLQQVYEPISKLTEGKYFLRKFVLDEDIGEVLHKADVVIARSGAHTVTELLALEKPSILIPIPWVSHNEQMENARILKKYGLAEILDEQFLSPGALVDMLKKILSNLRTYSLNDRSALDLINLEAGKIIADETLKISRSKKSQN